MNSNWVTKVPLVAVCMFVVSYAAPVANDSLQYKKTDKNVCEWDCSYNIDKQLETCEMVCHLESQNIKKLYGKHCQEVCAAKYVRCLQKCGKFMNTKTAPLSTL